MRIEGEEEDQFLYSIVDITIVSDEYRDGITFVTKWCKMDPNKAEYLPGYLPICQCYDGPSLVHIYS